jgi:hypothetical protein
MAAHCDYAPALIATTARDRIQELVAKNKAVLTFLYAKLGRDGKPRE